MISKNNNSLTLNIQNSTYGVYVNGKKAEELYNKYVFNQVNISCIVLPSTSPANASYTFDKLIKKWEVITNQ